MMQHLGIHPGPSTSGSKFDPPTEVAGVPDFDTNPIVTL